jgi:hypothetical protein
MQTPESPSLEALIRDADREEQYARLRALPTNQTVQLPTATAAAEPAEPVTFVPAPKALAEAALAPGSAQPPPPQTQEVAAAAKAVNVGLDAAAAPAELKPAPATTDAAATAPAATTAATAATPAAPAAGAAELLLMPESQDLKVGERRRVLVFLKTDTPLSLAAATLRFDPKALAVRSVTQGGLAADKAGAPVVTQSVDASGVLVVSVAPAAGAPPLTGEGLLLVIEVEGLAPGETGLLFDADKVHLVATDGRIVRPRTTPGRFKVTQ